LEYKGSGSLVISFKLDVLLKDMLELSHKLLKMIVFNYIAWKIITFSAGITE